METTFIALLREGLLKLNAEEPERRRIGLSQLDGCIRAAWYLNNGVAKSNKAPAEMVVVWEIGKFLEDLVIRALRAVGVVVEDQQRTVKWHDIEGHLDGVLPEVNHPRLIEFMGDGKYLLELKSARTDKIKNLKRKGVEQAQPGHYLQMQSYMHRLVAEGENIKGAVYLVINKATQFKAGEPEEAFYIEIVAPDFENAELQMNFLQHALGQPEVPARPYLKINPICNHCDYKDLCWSDEDF